MMAYIDTKYLGKCETCRHHRSGTCNTFCDCGEEYSPDLSKIPTADVVPKSEVERLKDKYEIIYQPKGMIEANAKSEVAREIFEEIENFIPRFKVGYFSYMSLTEGITELKKKYLEDKN